MIQNCFGQPVRNNFRTYDNIATGQGDDYIAGYLLYYNYFKNYYKMIDLNDRLKWMIDRFK